MLNNLNYFFLGGLPELSYMIQQALGEPKVAIHVCLRADHVVNVFLKLQIPSKVFDPLFLSLLFVALLVESMHILVCLGFVFLRH